jgi:hypothetical protein
MSVAMREPVDTLSSCLDRARATLRALDDEGVIHALHDIEGHLRKTHSVMLELVAGAESRRIAAHGGFNTTARLLAEMPQLLAAEAQPELTTRRW